MDSVLILTPTELLKYIEYLRSELIQTGLNHGFQNDRTIQASQELDYFIFEYQKLTSTSNQVGSLSISSVENDQSFEWLQSHSF